MATTKKKLKKTPLTPAQLAEELDLHQDQVWTGLIVSKTLAQEVFGHHNQDAVFGIFGVLEFDEDGNPPEDTAQLLIDLKFSKKKADELFEMDLGVESALQMYEHLFEDFVSSEDLESKPG